MQTIIYLRGLNSQGDDALRAGGLAFGPMYGPWLTELKRRGLNAMALTGFGAGRIAAQIPRARKLLEQSPEWRLDNNKFHLLGHSTGGLLARALVHELRSSQRFTSVVTMGTPHNGSALVDMAKDFSRLHPWLHRVFCKMNYDVNQRLDSFQDLAPAAAQVFNELYPDVPGVNYASIVCRLPLKEMVWPVRLANMVMDANKKMRDHDGYVESESQRWGHVIAELSLDHLGQTGFNFSLHPFGRRRHRAKFNLLVDHLVRYWQDIESRSTGDNPMRPTDL